MSQWSRRGVGHTPALRESKAGRSPKRIVQPTVQAKSADPGGRRQTVTYSITGRPGGLPGLGCPLVNRRANRPELARPSSCRLGLAAGHHFGYGRPLVDGMSSA
jgi:hypothetical protein